MCIQICTQGGTHLDIYIYVYGIFSNGDGDECDDGYSDNDNYESDQNALEE